jgi:hypothetical protein
LSPPPARSIGGEIEAHKPAVVRHRPATSTPPVGQRVRHTGRSTVSQARAAPM